MAVGRKEDGMFEAEVSCRDLVLRVQPFKIVLLKLSGGVVKTQITVSYSKNFDLVGLT